MAVIDELKIRVSADTSGANKGLSKLKSNIEFLTKLDTTQLTHNIELISHSLRQLSTIDLSNITRPFEAIASVNKALINNNALEKLEKLREKQKQLDENTTAETTTENVAPTFFDNLLESGKGFASKLVSLFKFRVAKAIVVYALNLIKNGIKNLSLVSPETNKALKNITNSIRSTFNSIAGIVTPLITAIEPILTNALRIVTSIANRLAQIVQMAFGWETVVEATNDRQTELNKNLKDGKNLMLGIDELNSVGSEDTQFTTRDVAKANRGMSQLWKSFEKLTDKVFEVVDKIVSDPELVKSIDNIFELLSEILDTLIPNVDVTITSLDSLSRLINGLLSLVYTLTGTSKELDGALTGTENHLKNIFNTINNNVIARIIVVNQLIDTTKTKFETLGTKISTWFETTNYKVKAFFDNIGEWFKNAWENIKEFFNKIADGFKNIFSKDSLSKLWDGIKNVGKNILPIQPLPFATGGFPEDDSIIAVNPYEIVGKMSNGKNVVANNQQITDGIAIAVQNALAPMVNAITSGNKGNIVIELDGKTIGKAVDSYNKNKGVGTSLFSGGVVNGI